MINTKPTNVHPEQNSPPSLRFLNVFFFSNKQQTSFQENVPSEATKYGIGTAVDRGWRV